MSKHFHTIDYRFPRLDEELTVADVQAEQAPVNLSDIVVDGDLDMADNNITNSEVLNTVILNANSLAPIGTDLNVSGPLNLGTNALKTDLIQVNSAAAVRINNNIDLNNNDITGLNKISTAGDLTFNESGNADYAFNTNTNSDQTFIIKDKNNTEALMRLESNNGSGLCDFICANDGHAAMYLRSNSYIHFGTNNQERMVIENTGNVIFRDGLACHGPLHYKIDTHTADQDQTIPSDRGFVELNTQPSANRNLYLPSFASTSFGHTIILKQTFNGQTGNHYIVKPTSGDSLQGVVNGQFAMNRNKECIQILRSFSSWQIISEYHD